MADSGNEAWPVAARGAAPPSSALFLLNSFTAAKSAFPAIKVEREPAAEPQSRVSAVSDIIISM